MDSGRVDRWLNRFQAWLSVAASLSVVAGVIIFFAVERPDARRNAQIESTLRYVALFQDGIIEQSRTALSRSWFEQADNLGTLADAGTVPASVMQRLAEIVVAGSPDDGSRNDLRFAVFRVAEFFDNLDLCVRTEICDGETAIRYFAPFAEKFYCIYRPVIEGFEDDVRIERFGEGLRTFARDNPSCEF